MRAAQVASAEEGSFDSTGRSPAGLLPVALKMTLDGMDDSN